MLFLKRDGSNNDFVLSRAGFFTKPFEFEDLVTKTPERKRSRVSFRFKNTSSSGLEWRVVGIIHLWVLHEIHLIAHSVDAVQTAVERIYRI